MIVDTSELIHLERSAEIDDEGIRRRFAHDSRIAAMTVSELMVGALRSDSEERLQRRLAFISGVRRHLPVIPFGAEEALEHARLLVFLRKAGTPVGDRDLQIAATAIVGGHIATRNVAEFARAPGLSVITLGAS